jgi:iron complex transport system substrate-binding protein
VRAFASLSAISLMLAGPAAATASAAAPVETPRRVASLNLCTDELLLALAPRGQIVSVTHLARSPAESRFWRLGRRHRPNDGSLLSVALLRPDLLITMGGNASDRLRIAPRLGIRTLDLPYPNRLDDVAQAFRRVAAALGRPRAAEPWLRRLAALRRSVPIRSRDAIWLGDGGRTVSASSLEAQWMRLTGLRQRRVAGDRVPLETLIARPPQVLLRIEYRQGQYSRGRQWLSHPLARRAAAGRTLASDGRAWTCMGPAMIAEAERLRGVFR